MQRVSAHVGTLLDHQHGLLVVHELVRPGERDRLGIVDWGMPPRGRRLGIVPGAFAYSALGGSLDDPASPEFAAALALALTLALVARRRGEGRSAE